MQDTPVPDNHCSLLALVRLEGCLCFAPVSQFRVLLLFIGRAIECWIFRIAIQIRALGECIGYFDGAHTWK